MTSGEYIQMRAFARVDGVLVALVWSASFAFYIAGMSNPILMMIALVVGVASPVYAAMRLRRYRDGICGGTLSFMRGYAYSALVFLYAALLFAVVQFVYFQYLDNGFLATQILALNNEPDMKAALKSSGMERAFNETINMMLTIRPIDYALNYFTTNILLGLILGFPIAGFLKKAKAAA